MTEETTAATEPVEETKEAVEETVPASRFAEMAKHKKAADAKAKELERQVNDLRSQMEDRESAGLPELEQMKRQMAKLEQRAAEAEQERDQTRTEAQTIRAEGWISAAARDAGFEDPEDAVLRISAGDVESPEDAERAVKRLAKAKPRLLKAEEPQMPGQVIKNGTRTSPAQPGVPAGAQPGSAFGLISTADEAAAVSEALANFQKTRQATRITFGA